MYDMKDKHILGVDDAMLKWGINPERIPDVQALIGDARDNIPRIPGMKRATATQLLQEYGSIEELLKDITNPVLEKFRLRDFVEQIKLNYQLCKLRENVPVPSLDALKAQEIQRDSLFSFLEKWKFPSIKAKWNKDHSEVELEEDRQYSLPSKDIM